MYHKNILFGTFKLLIVKWIYTTFLKDWRILFEEKVTNYKPLNSYRQKNQIHIDNDIR